MNQDDDDDDVRGEIALLRAAIEGLASARERVPDYGPTLAYISESLKDAREGIDQIAQSPAARLSPTSLTLAIVKASTDARAHDAQLIAEARDALSRSVGRIDGIVERGQAADCQTRRVVWGVIGGVLVGILLWSIIPGAIARRLPTSWHVPEWMAARVIGVDAQTAAQRLSRTVAAGKPAVR
jgi:hypothetical protein